MKHTEHEYIEAGYKYDSFVHLYGEHPIENARLVALTTSEAKRPRINVWN